MTTASLPEGAGRAEALAPSRSLLRKHLTPPVWQSLKDVHTASGVTLHDCIASGLAHSDSAIGVYAGDAESLERFGLLFAPLIADLHTCAPACSKPGCDTPEQGLALCNPDPQGLFIRSTRIRLARNLQGFRLMPAISPGELQAVQALVQEALWDLPPDLAGSYRALGLAPAAAATNCAPRAGFDASDRFQQAAGICRNWPQGRGVFSNPDQSLQVWVNEEDHLRIISMQDGADIQAVYTRLLRAYGQLEQALRFAWSARYGFLSACPSNLGTGLRASFHIDLPLSGGSPEFRTLCAQYGISVRSAAGEGTRQQGAVYDISNQRRLGLSPEQCLRQLLVATARIIALETQCQQQRAA